MCGRFALYRSSQALQDHFEATLDGSPIVPRYNLAPRTTIPAVRVGADGTRRFVWLHWGLIPSWAKDRGISQHTINARAETVAEKPSYRTAFRRSRCLIPADGFYEWQSTPSGKQPWFFTRRDGQPLALAGLWERWIDPAGGEPVESTTIIVTQANDVVRPIHDRMPVILSPTDYACWLDPRMTRSEPLQALLVPAAPGMLTAYPVGRRVNRVREDDAALIEPLTMDDPGADNHDPLQRRLW